jgi:tetratricopeptide (TPR) repeat protein
MTSTGTSRIFLSAGLLLLAATFTERSLAGRANEVRVESFRLLNEGVSAYNRGLYEEAVDRLRRSTAIALSSFRAHYYLGLSLNATREYREAIEILTIALDLNPGDLRTLVGLGDAQLKLGDVGESRANYVLALKIRPAYPPALDGLARSYEAQAKDDQAIDYYRQALLSNKGYAPTYTHLGDLYMRREEIRKAVLLLEEAVTIRPDFAEGHNRLAVAYGSLGLHNEAVATVQKAIELDPTNPEHLYALGWLQLNQGVTAPAMKSFRHALDLDPRMAEARIGLAEVARRDGDYVLAQAELAEALKQPELDPELEQRISDRLVAVVRERQRLGELHSLVATGHASHKDYGELADLYVRRSQWGLAAELQYWAPPSPEQREWLAYLLFRDGQYREAYRIYAELSETRTDSVLRLNAGIALAWLGNDPAAVEAYDQVLAADPEHRLARLYLANAQLRLGAVESAAKNYRTFLDAGGASEPAERVRRILTQIAPELLPDEPQALIPPAPPPPEFEEEEEEQTAS